MKRLRLRPPVRPNAQGDVPFHAVGAARAATAVGVRLANHTPYGLNAMVLTQNLWRAHRVRRRFGPEPGEVNCFFAGDLRAPFGGVGDSGVGRDGSAFSR